MAINKTTAALTAGITIAAPQVVKSLRSYVLSSAGPTLTGGTSVAATATNAFVYRMPAMSVTLLVP